MQQQLLMQGLISDDRSIIELTLLIQKNQIELSIVTQILGNTDKGNLPAWHRESL